ncbi:MAG: hypothetical protein ABI608_10050, partial [Rhizomicrobium sp.]
VILKRFLAPDLVFILDILLSLRLPDKSGPPWLNVRVAHGGRIEDRHGMSSRAARKSAPSIRGWTKAQGKKGASPKTLILPPF